MKLRLCFLMAAGLGVAVTDLASAAAPPGWIIAGTSPTHYAFAVDPMSPVGGSRSASISAKPGATSTGFGTLMQVIAADAYRGSRLRLSGYLRTRNADRAQMWMRVDGPDHKVLAFDNMDSRPVTGTTEWKRYDIVLEVPQNSVDVALGYFLAGRGKVWGADFKLDKVGATIPVTSQGPILPRKPENLDFEAAPAQQGVEAVWASRQVSFVYRGFTTRYSCDGLRDKVRRLLTKLGARDLKVREQRRSTLSGPDPYPGVRVSMQVLVRASLEQGKNAGPMVAAHWQKVVLMPSTASLQQQDKCELIEQFKEAFLPLFATRHVSFESNCIPHEVDFGNHLSVEALMPDVKAVEER
ncbi:MAG: hypothetical protein WBW93_20415 [Steroidobacteraceae bacterium]